MQRGLAACEPLGALVPGPRPLEGKSFYLDEVKSQSCGVLTKLIVRLGGKVESFLYKDVNVVITGNRDALTAAAAGKVKGRDSAREKKGQGSDACRRPGPPRAPVCGSRGKALLEKAIRNNEQSRGGVLSSAAQYWGVKIVSVEQFLKVIDELNSQSSTHTQRRREEKNPNEVLCGRVIKAGSLKVDFVKVEDLSRKYRPLYGQSLDFPMLSYTRRFSPFENPAPVQSGKVKEDKLGRNDEPISSHDKPTPPVKTSHKKKILGYCECCQMKYRDQDEHLKSDVHQRFVDDGNNYTVVDQLMAAMDAVFSECKAPQVQALKTRLPSNSEAPLAQMEQQDDGEIGTCQTNQEAEPAASVPVLPPEPQEPCVDVPPYTSMETKFVEVKQNYPDCEPHPPSPQPGHGCVLDSKPLACNPPSPEVASDGPNPSVVQEPTEICPRPLPSPKASLNDDRGSVTCLRSPPKQHRNDKAGHLPSHEQLIEQDQIPLVDASSCSLSVKSLPFRSFSMTLSDGVNPRKRSRSFTLSPKASKMRRTNLWSDPTSHDSGVSLRSDHVQQTAINSHTAVQDVPECQLETADQDAGRSVETPDDRLSFQNEQIHPNIKAHEASSEPGPPQLYPFYHDDVYQNQPPFLEPPTLAPSVPVPPTRKASSASLPSQSFSSFCIDSALIPDTFSPGSSESDWDSGLLSRLAPPVHLQPKGGHCELDLGLLLQSSCTGMQDGSYTSRLCSVLQPTTASSHAGFGDRNTVYRPIETMDRRIVPSLGV